MVSTHKHYALAITLVMVFLLMIWGVIFVLVRPFSQNNVPIVNDFLTSTVVPGIKEMPISAEQPHPSSVIVLPNLGLKNYTTARKFCGIPIIPLSTFKRIATLTFFVSSIGVLVAKWEIFPITRKRSNGLYLGTVVSKLPFNEKLKRGHLGAVVLSLVSVICIVKYASVPIETTNPPSKELDKKAVVELIDLWIQEVHWAIILRSWQLGPHKNKYLFPAFLAKTQTSFKKPYASMGSPTPAKDLDFLPKSTGNSSLLEQQIKFGEILTTSLSSTGGIFEYLNYYICLLSFMLEKQSFKPPVGNAKKTRPVPEDQIFILNITSFCDKLVALWLEEVPYLNIVLFSLNEKMGIVLLNASSLVITMSDIIKIHHRYGLLFERIVSPGTFTREAVSYYTTLLEQLATGSNLSRIVAIPTLAEFSQQKSVNSSNETG